MGKLDNNLPKAFQIFINTMNIDEFCCTDKLWTPWWLMCELINTEQLPVRCSNAFWPLECARDRVKPAWRHQAPDSAAHNRTEADLKELDAMDQ